MWIDLRPPYISYRNWGLELQIRDNNNSIALISPFNLVSIEIWLESHLKKLSQPLSMLTSTLVRLTSPKKP